MSCGSPIHRAWCSCRNIAERISCSGLACATRASLGSRAALDWGLRGVLPNGAALLVDSQSMLRPPELERLVFADGSSQRLTHVNDSLLKDLELPCVTEQWVRASDGQMIHCWVIYPPDFDPSRKWPVITYCQGGPQSQIGQWFSYRWNFHLMAARGYVVDGAQSARVARLRSSVERSDQPGLGRASDAGYFGRDRRDDDAAVHGYTTYGCSRREFSGATPSTG